MDQYTIFNCLVKTSLGIDPNRPPAYKLSMLKSYTGCIF